MMQHSIYITFVIKFTIFLKTQAFLHSVSTALPKTSSSVFHHIYNNSVQRNRKSQMFAKEVIRIDDRTTIRGGSYGAGNNSTILSPQEVANIIGVKPSIEASKKTWKRAWMLHKHALPYLHMPERIKFNVRIPFRRSNVKQDNRNNNLQTFDSSLNLACLWWKAIAGNDSKSLAYDDKLSFDLLPKGTRYIVHPLLVRLGIYPRLHHANVELRTVFLDNAVKDLVQVVKDKAANSAPQEQLVKASNFEKARDATTNVSSEIGFTTEEKLLPVIKFRLISMGAGYDVRSIKLLTKGIVDEAYELDLPEVVKSKEMLLGPNRLRKRKPTLKDYHMPKLIGVNLNRISEVKEVLSRIVDSDNNVSKYEIWHNIFLFEGVMIYLDEGIPSALLNTCSSVIHETLNAQVLLQSTTNETEVYHASLCLADRMENVPGGDIELGKEELRKNGWSLKTWLPKPGLARHMCTATLLKRK